LDTLFLAAPISFKGRLVQYAGRILRPHPGKTTAEVHDYHDTNTPVLAASLARRAPGYTSLGFPDPRRTR
jgi:superfamily II DNA or RNA helicase